MKTLVWCQLLIHILFLSTIIFKVWSFSKIKQFCRNSKSKYQLEINRMSEYEAPYGTPSRSNNW